MGEAEPCGVEAVAAGRGEGEAAEAEDAFAALLVAASSRGAFPRAGPGPSMRRHAASNVRGYGLIMPAALLSTVDIPLIVVNLLGGLALFLFGIALVSEALRSAAGAGMKSLLATLTTSRLRGAAVGAIVTAIIQSSTVTTVLVVGFISAGVMTLPQSVGVIMGANIGSTVTAQIIAFKVTQYALAIIAAGFLMREATRHDRLRQAGSTLLGLGLIFLAMDLMSGVTRPLRDDPVFIELMGRMDHPLAGVLAGAVFTAVVQSSAATAGVVIMLASQGLVTLEAGIALTLGANIGTCSTALLAAIGRPREAMQAAVVHLLFNLIGVALWIGLVHQLADLSRWISPTAPGAEGAARLAAEVPRQIANAHTIFNVLNTLVLIWFAGPIARLAQRLAPAKPAVPDTEERKAAPRYLDKVFLETPSLALAQVRLELGHVGESVVRLIEIAPPVVMRGDEKNLARLESMDDDIDSLYDAVIAYTRQLATGKMNRDESQEMEDLLAVANHLEATADVITMNLVMHGRKRIERGLRISDETMRALLPLQHAVTAAMQAAVKAVVERDAALAGLVLKRHEEIARMTESIHAHLQRRLVADEPNRVRIFRLEADVTTQIRNVYDHARRIARIVAGRAAAAAPAPSTGTPSVHGPAR